jgi:DNA polymerase III subunit epsilon
MAIELSKPLALIDLETTGINVSSDRIVEISILKILPTGHRITYTKRVNPTIPISAESSSIHHISNADVANEKTFNDLAYEILYFIDDADLGGYNSNKFDVPLLVEEFLRCGINFEIRNRKLIDVQNIFHKMEQRTLAAAYKFYCEKEIVNAHSAEADILATFEVLEAQLEKYADLQPNADFLHEFSKPKQEFLDFAGRIVLDENHVPVFNFGKHKGKTVENVFRIEPSYYSWMMNGDFPLYTKKIITEIKDNMVK